MWEKSVHRRLAPRAQNGITNRRKRNRMRTFSGKSKLRTLRTIGVYCAFIIGKSVNAIKSAQINRIK